MELIQSVRKIVSVAILFLLAAGSVIAQLNKVEVNGKIKDDDSGRKLPGSFVVVLQDGSEIERAEVNKNAEFDFSFELGHSYTLKFERVGFMAKMVVLDFSHAVPDENADAFGLYGLDMTLIKEIEGFDVTILDTPVGMGVYDPDTKKFTFDSDHTDRMKMRIENEMNRLAAIEENRAKNKRAFDIAMKEGEDFMKKKKWQEALASFNIALELIPNEGEAVENRDKCRSKLDEIAKEEAEDQAKEDAKRAEEEAKRAAEETERIAMEEEAEKRRADLESRRNGNRNGNKSSNNASDKTNSNNQTEQDDFVPRDKEVAEDNTDARRAQEQAKMDARNRADEEAAEEEAARRKKEQEEEAKRAELLAKSANNRSDEADNFFREALKSENMARAADIEAKKQSGENMLRQREGEAVNRREDVRNDLQEKVENVQRTAQEANQRFRDNASDVVGMHNSQKDFTQRHQAQATNSRTDKEVEIKSKKDSQHNLDKSKDKEVQSMYPGRKRAHQDEIEYTQSLLNANSTRQKGAMDQRRIDANLNGYDEATFQHNNYRGEFERNAGTPKLSLSDEELPQGFHEYSYEIPNGTVIELTFRDGDKVVRYKKVLMKTGTFYFRDNKSITASIFHRETTVVHD